MENTHLREVRLCLYARGSAAGVDAQLRAAKQKVLDLWAQLEQRTRGAEHRSSVVAIALIASALIQAVDNAGPENLLAIRAGRIALGTDADADSKVK